MNRRTFALLVGTWIGAAGCGGGGDVKTVPVSGVVTLDGKALEKALVRFEPTGGTKEGWSDSSGITDAQGRYSLSTPVGQAGAVAGPQKVTIAMVPDADAVDSSTEGQPAPKVRPKALIPAKYNTNSELTFDVPAGGSDAANFDLKSR